MPYYALINGRHATPALDAVASIKEFVEKGLKTRYWPQGNAMDGSTDMVEIYDMAIKDNGSRELVEKYFWKDGDVVHKDDRRVGTHTISTLMSSTPDPEKLFVDIAIIEDPTTSTEDGSFAMNFDKAYMSEDGDEDGKEHYITRINDQNMFKVIIDAVSKDFVDNRLDGKSILKIEYGVRAESFMLEDTYIQGWIYDRKGQLIEQHGYPRKGW